MSCKCLSVTGQAHLVDNISALSFLLVTGAADQALEWQELTADERANILREYNAAGISLMVSLFGSTDTPTTSGYDATTTANAMAAWALQYGVLGVDIDYEVCSTARR